MRGVLEFAEPLLGNPVRAWMECDPGQKQRIWAFLLPEGLDDAGESLGADRISPLFLGWFRLLRRGGTVPWLGSPLEAKLQSTSWHLP